MATVSMNLWPPVTSSIIYFIQSIGSKKAFNKPGYVRQTLTGQYNVLKGMMTYNCIVMGAIKSFHRFASKWWYNMIESVSF